MTPREALLDWCVTHDVEEPGIEGSGVRHVLRTLAAALTERAR